MYKCVLLKVTSELPPFSPATNRTMSEKFSKCRWKAYDLWQFQKYALRNENAWKA